MLKNLAIKAIMPVAITVTGFVVLGCLILYSLIRNDLIADTIQHETGLADTIVKSTRYAMLKDDRESLGEMIRNIGSQQGVEHVRIFNKKGLVMFSANPDEMNHIVDKDAAGCVECHSGPVPATHLGDMEKARQFRNRAGNDVIAITAPVYSEESCVSSSCHVHPADQQVLGTLDIGLSAEPLRQTLQNLRLRMILFCLMVLVLTISGVAALLRRNVLLPIRNLVCYADEVLTDPERKPPTGAAEVEVLGRTLQRLAQDRRKAEQQLRSQMGGESLREPPRSPQR